MSAAAALLRVPLRAGDLELVPAGPPPERPRGPLPVTVVIPAYQRESLVERAVRSAFGQGSAPAQVLVVDDGSSDDTAGAARRAGADVVRLEGNRGAAHARSIGVREAGQPWVAFLDSDDEWLPWMLETLWPRRAGHVLVAGASIWVRGGRVERYEGLAVGECAVLRGGRALVWPQNFVPAAGALVDRDALLRASPAAPRYRYSEDFATWLRLLADATGLVVARPVVRYHLHEGQKAVSDARLVDQHAMVRELAGDRPWGAAQLRRRMAVDAWDQARTRPGGRSVPALLRRTGRPDRALAVGGVLAWRRLQDRRWARLTPDGDLDPPLWTRGVERAAPDG